MKPISSPISKEALDLMNKAQFMIERIDTIEKKLEMVEHEGKQVPAFAADGRGKKDLKEKGEGSKKCPSCKVNKMHCHCGGRIEKAKKCPECGEGMNKMGCMKMGCKMYSGKMEKAQPEYTTSYNTNPQENMFVVESGGQTRSAYYTTNQHLLDSQDVANKGASSSSVNLQTLASQMNPHEGGGADRLDVEGKISKSDNSPY
tara:strand:+ start:17510 stop:18115 length:606 start_codon:yes stop_codon:yes gene_type:complete